MYSVESAFDQNSRSASSSLNLGIFFKRFIRSPFTCIHVSCGYRPHQPPTDGKGNKQPARPIRLPKSEVSVLFGGMAYIRAESDWHVEKDFLNLPVRHAMLRPVLSDVSVVPIAPVPLGWIKLRHWSI